MRTLTRQKLRGFRSLRGRHNPTILAPAGVAQRSWTDQLGREKSELRSALLLFRRQLLEKGVAEGDLPTPDQISQHAGEASVILASSQYADLAEQSKLLTPTATVADEVLGLSPGGIFEKVASESLAKSTKNAMVSKLDARRELALSKRAMAGKEVRAAEQLAKEALFERVEAEERRRKEEAGEGSGSEQIISRADIRQLAEAMKAEAEEGVREAEGDEDEDEDEAEEDEAPKKKRSSSGRSRKRAEVPAPRRVSRDEAEDADEDEDDAPAPRFEGALSKRGDRLSGYADFLTRVRVRTVLDPKLAAAAKDDILLYVLNDGTTQVWIKGALTETFQSKGRGGASWSKAKGYAEIWLGKEGLTGGMKKSRMNVRVLFSTEEEPGTVRVVLPSYNEMLAQKAKKVPPSATIFDELVGKKANPRERAFRNPKSEAIVQQLRASFRRTNGIGTVQGIRSNPRKLAVPEYVAKTPRKMGERISAIGVKGKWPIGDLFHARLAAVYIMSPSHRAKKAQVLRALELNWPQYDWRGFLAKGESVRLRKVANPSLPNQEQLDFLGKVTLEARKATEAINKAKTPSALRDAAADALDAAIEAEEAAQEAHESSRQTWRRDSPEAVVAIVQAIRAAMAAAAAARAAVKVADARAERGERLRDAKLRMAMLARVR